MIVCLGCPGCQGPLLSPGTPLWMGATWLPISPMDNGESFRPIDAQASKICPGWGTLIEGGCYVVSIRLPETLSVLGSTVKYQAGDHSRWVGYDDVDSIRLKAQFVNSRGLAGSMVWWEETLATLNLFLSSCRSIESDDFRADYGPKYPLISEVVFLLSSNTVTMLCYTSTIIKLYNVSKCTILIWLRELQHTAYRLIWTCCYRSSEWWTRGRHCSQSSTFTMEIFAKQLLSVDSEQKSYLVSVVLTPLVITSVSLNQISRDIWVGMQNWLILCVWYYVCMRLSVLCDSKQIFISILESTR